MTHSISLSWIDLFRNKFIFRLFYWGVRTGMALTFMLSGLRKLPGVKFTILPIDNPVGAYFHAMYETGFYWNFIGYFQIAVGFLLLFNRFVVLSALLIMPVTINIFLISISLHMKGTPVITSLMVLGNLFLLMWHYEHYLPMLKKPDTEHIKLLSKK